MSTMTNKRVGSATNDLHKVFVLRLWREKSTDIWRLAIQSRSAAQPHGLPTLAALTEFVQSEMDAA